MSLQGVGRLEVLGVPQFTSEHRYCEQAYLTGGKKKKKKLRIPEAPAHAALAVNQSNVGPRPRLPPPSCQLPLPPHRLPARRGIITAH